jgi:glutathione S-transferase
MRLYGTTTSPYVRRVRIVARECGVRCELLDTSTDAGQAALRAVSPIGKVPVAELDGRTIYDSRAIVEWLTTTRGWGELAPPRDRFAALNQLNAIDGALDAGIHRFYLARDGVRLDGIPVAERELARLGAILDWAAAELDAGWIGRELGMTEVALIGLLDWLEFRAVEPLAWTRRPGPLAAFRAAHRDRPSLVATRPT